METQITASTVLRLTSGHGILRYLLIYRQALSCHLEFQVGGREFTVMLGRPGVAEDKMKRQFPGVFISSEYFLFH